MQAVILAAGEGTRMRPLTIVKPKPLIEVSGKPFLYFLFKNLEKAGIKDIVLVVGSKKEQFQECLRKYDFRATLVEQEERLGTGHAISILDGKINGNFIAVYGDNLYSPDDIKKLENSDDYCYVTGFEHPNPEKYGVIVENSGFLERIVEKPNEKIGNLINTGLYKLTPEIFSALKMIEKSPRGEYELTDAISILAKQKKVKVLKLEDYWIDFASLEDLPVVDRKLNEMMEEVQIDYYFEDIQACPIPKAFTGIAYPWEALDKKDEIMRVNEKNEATVEENVTIKGPVSIGKGTIIRSGAVITGPAIIGENCVIKQNALIRDKAVIGNNVVIGHAAEIKNSIVFNEAKIQSFAFCGDSIVGKGARIGSGAVTTNRRFDQQTITIYIHDKQFPTRRDKFGCILGDYSRLGSNVSATPGSLVGKHSWIYANVLVRGFVPKNSLVKLRQAIEIVNKDAVILEHKDKEGRI